MRRVPFFRSLVVVVLASAVCVLSAHAQSYPTKPVHLLVSNTPGSTPDVLARYLGTRLTEAWKQPVVVENRGGGGGIVATDAVAKASPDGYTLLVGADGPITILPVLQKNLPYDVQRDLVPVASLGETDFLLVANPKTGFKTLQDFITAARAQPGRYNYASAGNGTALQLSMEQLKQNAGIHVTHIPYRGGPLGMADVIAGQVDVMFIAVTPALPHVRDGRLVALASGGAARHTLLPNVPTVAESYKGFRAGTWFGLFAPANTPQAVVDALGVEADRILANPATRAELAAQGVNTTGYAQTRFRNQVQTESRRYAQLAQQVGIHGD